MRENFEKVRISKCEKNEYILAENISGYLHYEINNNENECKTIRDFRKEKGLTLHQLSELSGVSVTQIQSIEVGKIKLENITVKNFMALCKALKVNPCDIYKMDKTTK